MPITPKYVQCDICGCRNPPKIVVAEPETFDVDWPRDHIVSCIDCAPSPD